MSKVNEFTKKSNKLIKEQTKIHLVKLFTTLI